MYGQESQQDFEVQTWVSVTSIKNKLKILNGFCLWLEQENSLFEGIYCWTINVGKLFVLYGLVVSI
jgi:hypothetical protein